MGICYISRRGKRSGSTEQLGIYPVGNNGRPMGNVVMPNNISNLSSTIFKANANVLTVVFPDKLQQMESSSFDSCTSLQEVSLPDTVLSLPPYCFANCSSLSKVKLSKNLGSIGSYAFQKCVSLYDILIPSSTARLTIGNYAFADCSLLNNIIMPENLISIGNYAFSGCSVLNTINFPNELREITMYAFNNCTMLSNIKIDDNANFELGSNAFAHCKALTNEDVNNILNHAVQTSTTFSYIFDSCTNLTELNVKFLDAYMFRSCTRLKRVNMYSGTRTGDNTFTGCTNLVEIRLSDITDTIGESVFYGCNNLKKIYLPSSITTAKNSSLTSTSSSYYFLYNCPNLEDCEVGKDWNMALRLSVSNKITVDSMVNMFNNLKDLTGTTAKTLTLGSTNLAKLTDEQKAIATNKNWTLS